MTTSPDDELKTLAKGGRTFVSGFFIRLIARIPFLIIGAQWYGAAALGRLAYAIVVVEFAAQISTLGLKRGLALHLSGDGQENGAWDAVLVVLTVTLIPTALFMIFPQILFPNSLIKPLDYLMPLVIPGLALSEVMLAALAYRLDIKSTVRARAIIEPWTISIAAIALWWSTPSDGMLVAYALSMGAALVASVVPFLKSYGLPHAWKPKGGELLALMRRNLPLAAADAIEWGTRRLDVLILGLFVPPAVVGIYWVAQQIASLPQKLKTSFDPVLAPVITTRLKEDDMAGVARQVSQAGFWILAAQAGVTLALALPGAALMSLIGSERGFAVGHGALIFLLLAEVAASAAVVSEAALVYMARYRNVVISFLVIGLQAGVSLLFITLIRGAGFNDYYQGAGVAAALMVALAAGSFLKTRLLRQMLGIHFQTWRWPLIQPIALAVMVGFLVTRLPEWASAAIGIPLILVAYGWLLWTRVFGEEDRVIFRSLR